MAVDPLESGAPRDIGAPGTFFDQFDSAKVSSFAAMPRTVSATQSIS